MKWFLCLLVLVSCSCTNLPKAGQIGMAEEEWKKKNPFRALAAASPRTTVYVSGGYYYYFENAKLTRIDMGASILTPQVNILNAPETRN
jgi:hypothetical protein